MYLRGLMARYNSNYLHVREVINNTLPEVDLTNYAIEGNHTRDATDNNTVYVPRPSLGITQEQYMSLIQMLEVMVHGPSDTAIIIYLRVFNCVHSYLHSL